jgi:hypothetical protein
LWYYSSRALKKKKTTACRIFPTSILALHFEFYFFNPKLYFFIFILDLREKKKQTKKEKKMIGCSYPLNKKAKFDVIVFFLLIGMLLSCFSVFYY